MDAFARHQRAVDMTEKLTRAQASDYWQNVHERSDDPINAVCHPDKGRVLNAFFAWSHRFAVSRALKATAFKLALSSALDVGCGRGRWLSYYESRGATAVGVDISPTAVAACRAIGLDAREASLDDIPVETASMDLVSSITVMLHLDPSLQDAAAQEMQRVVRPGGLVVLLESTIVDQAAHVWPRTVDGWVDLFDECDPVLVEAHRYAWLVRALWKSPAVYLPRRILRVLETVVATYSLPLEWLLMTVGRQRQSELGQQHVIVLRRRPSDA